ncbi:hypothetical protein [Streptomyces naphthomycinicus]|uniref:hypothetical protein n=1 Tax=Streptomyces naphthomycinicus TaxID=2872625 RepID=UPI001CED7C48|nr:hypothetical protein [Streptomyces sp. TML10]
MSARHAAPDRDRLGTALAARWAVLHLLGFATLGLVMCDERSTATDHRAAPGDFVRDSEPAPA